MVAGQRIGWTFRKMERQEYYPRADTFGDSDSRHNRSLTRGLHEFSSSLSAPAFRHPEDSFPERLLDIHGKEPRNVEYVPVW